MKHPSAQKRTREKSLRASIAPESGRTGAGDTGDVSLLEILLSQNMELSDIEASLPAAGPHCKPAKRRIASGAAPRAVEEVAGSVGPGS